jgi:UDP-N-acetylglucosamine 2-epimerase (non-hydrolysing)
VRENKHQQQDRPPALSIIGGRPHLVKAESVHGGLRAVGHRHVGLRTSIGHLSDYPRDADFDLPLLPLSVSANSTESLVRPLRETLMRMRPDAVLLYGDLPTTAAAYEAASSLGIPIVHVEAGYRSGDLSDLEEHTRIAVDRGADAHLVYSDAMTHVLLDEGIPRDAIVRVPDPARLALNQRLRSLGGDDTAQWRGLVTFHRSETLGSKRLLTSLVAALERIGATWPLTVVLYATTRSSLMRAELLGRLSRIPGVSTTSTLPIAAYAHELRSARFVITDSSGVQDDCVTVGRTCLVVRRASPRPVKSPVHLVNPHELDAAHVESTVASDGALNGDTLTSIDAPLLLGKGAAEAIAIAKRRSRRAGRPPTANCG